MHQPVSSDTMPAVSGTPTTSNNNSSTSTTRKASNFSTSSHQRCSATGASSKFLTSAQTSNATLGPRKYSSTSCSLLPDTFISIAKSTNEQERCRQIQSLFSQIFPNDELSEIKTLSGGVTNVLYKIQLRNRSRPVLCRINGMGSEKIIDRNMEITYMIRVMQDLSHATVHCRFGNGIVYDYIEGVPLQCEEVPEHAEGIAREMARFHQLKDMEGDRSPMLFRVLDDWIEHAKQIDFHDLPERQNKLESLQFKEKILPEIELMRRTMEGWDVVFCHNDVLGLNVIFNEKNKTYSFIDFEYCGYNYRAFDLGDHFFEHLGLEVIDPKSYPSVTQQKRFVRAYLRELEGGQEPSERDVEILRRKANIAGLAANLFWGTWSLYQAKNSSIDFDYLEYGSQRFSMYFQFKDQLFEDPDAVRAE